jgi:DNA-binding IscR family transcriptional regulator
MAGKMGSYRLLDPQGFASLPTPHQLVQEKAGDLNWTPYFQPHQYFHIPVQITTPLIPTDGLLSAIGVIRSEIAEVKESLSMHQELLEEILTAVRGSATEIEIEDVDDDEARARIQALFKNSDNSLFYDEIAERLKLPLRQTVEICNQLETEGLIGERTA